MATPHIISTVPQNSETNVYVNQNLHVVFDVPILRSSLNPNTLLIYRATDYSQVTGEVTYDENLRTAKFIPHKVLDTDTGYTFIIVGADQSEDCIKSETLESLQYSEAVQFVTGSEKYQEPAKTQQEILAEERYAPPPTVMIPEPVIDPDFSVIDVHPDNGSTSVGTILPSGLCFIRQIDGVPVPYSRPILYELAPEHPDPSGLYTIYVRFNRDLWPSGNQYIDWLRLEAEPVTGDPAIHAAIPSGFIVPPSGDTLFWTSLDPSGWYQNNEITVTISPDIMSASGYLLGREQKFMFTTAYRPMYCSISKIRLAIGPYIRDIPDDTINRRIYENSLITFQLANIEYGQNQWDIDNPSFAAKMYTCCKTQYDLLNAKLLEKSCSAGEMKRLGDFSIQNPVDIRKALSGPIDSALACMEFWVDRLVGRDGKVHAKMAVKGVSNASTPPVRGVRTWIKDPLHIPASNTKRQRSKKTPNIYSKWS
jgi:hypothetical protein